jgi:hypothetical protein
MMIAQVLTKSACAKFKCGRSVSYCRPSLSAVSLSYHHVIVIEPKYIEFELLTNKFVCTKKVIISHYSEDVVRQV